MTEEKVKYKPIIYFSFKYDKYIWNEKNEEWDYNKRVSDYEISLTDLLSYHDEILYEKMKKSLKGYLLKDFGNSDVDKEFAKTVDWSDFDEF